MSFWVVPDNSFLSTPCFSAVAMYRASNQAAGALMVIEVFIFSSGIFLKSVSILPM